MKVRQKIVTVILVLAFALASLGWIASHPTAPARVFAQWSTSSGQASTVSSAQYGIAAELPANPKPVVSPFVSWNS